jgi:RNA polymerase sigma-70 factor (ECF subfamily)
MDVEAKATEATDEQIVERVLGGELELYEVLIRRHNRRLFRIAYSIVENADEAEDVTQDAYVRAYANLGQFAGRAKFATWLGRIAVHEALARARRSGRTVNLGHREEQGPGDDLMESLPSTAAGPEEQMIGKEVGALLESAVAGLAPIYRSVFVLREVEGLSVTETAESLGIREEAVKTRLHRARAQLRSDLLRKAGPHVAEIFAFHLVRCDRVVNAVLRRIRAGDVPPAGDLPF